MGDSTVILSAAKYLSARRDRPFAALRVTGEGPIMVINEIIQQWNRQRGPIHRRWARSMTLLGNSKSGERYHENRAFSPLKWGIPTTLFAWKRWRIPAKLHFPTESFIVPIADLSASLHMLMSALHIQCALSCPAPIDRPSSDVLIFAFYSQCSLSALAASTSIRISNLLFIIGQ
jgi:hypothetical protein